MHLRRGKVSTRTCSAAEIDLLVHGKADSWPHHIIPQVVHQFPERLHLPGGRPRLREIANETNTNAHLVDLLAMHVAALNLPEPARTNLDLAITGIDAIPDHEVIGQSVLHPALAMCFPVNGGVALPNRAVMRHYPLPPARSNAQSRRRLTNFSGVSIDWRTLGRFGRLG